MITKLRLRFILINMGIVTVLLYVMMSMVFRYNMATLENQSISYMRQVAALTAGPGAAERPLPEGPMMACFVVETDPAGTLSAWGSRYYDLSDKDALSALLAQARATGEETGVLESDQLRFFRADPRGSRYLFADVSGKREILKNIRSSCVGVGSVSFVAFFAVSVVLSVWATRPVKKAWQQQRQFVADASHELKTPLSVIMANAELLQDGSCDTDSARRFSGHILSMSYQMRSLVERMLETARADNAPRKLAPLDFSQLAQDAVLSVQLLFEEKGRGLQSRIQEDLWIRGNESQLYQLLDVLLDNALKYSQGEGPVEVTLCTSPRTGGCVLSVRSPGPELTRQQRRDIFKRFYRVDQARSLDGSYGLGLSIAQRIVELHRGRIRVNSAENTNTFSVYLPVCSPRNREFTNH